MVGSGVLVSIVTCYGYGAMDTTAAFAMCECEHDVAGDQLQVPVGSWPVEEVLFGDTKAVRTTREQDGSF